METLDENADLPEGWMRCYSKSLQGKLYYFNTLTGESMWEHPEACLMNSQVSKFYVLGTLFNYSNFMFVYKYQSGKYLQEGDGKKIAPMPKVIVGLKILIKSSKSNCRGRLKPSRIVPSTMHLIPISHEDHLIICNG